MNKLLLILIIVASFLCSCGSDYYAKEASSFDVCLFVTPDRYSGEVAPYFSPKKEIYAEQNQSLKVYAGLKFDDKTIVGDSIYNYVESIRWNINGKTYNIPNFRLTFNETGHTQGYLAIVDSWGDTSRQDFDIYVNTPNKISLVAPYNGYNQVEPLDKDMELPMRWELSGLDEWEHATCEVYLSQYSEDIWSSFNIIGTTDCHNNAILTGQLFSDTLSSLYNSSQTFYWTVKAFITSDLSFSEDITSELFHFSTKPLNPNFSSVVIPFTLSNYHGTSKVQTSFDFVNGAGDTIAHSTSDKSSGTITIPLLPQSAVTVYVRENNRKEYSADSIKLDIPQRTVISLNTVTLKDKVKPQIAPVSSVFPVNSDNEANIVFNIYDDGSGFNSSKLQIQKSNNTITFATYEEPFCRFKIEVQDRIRFQIQGEDFAKNSLPDVYWEAARIKDSLYIYGPYLSGEPDNE